MQHLQVFAEENRTVVRYRHESTLLCEYKNGKTAYRYVTTCERRYVFLPTAAVNAHPDTVWVKEDTDFREFGRTAKHSETLEKARQDAARRALDHILGRDCVQWLSEKK